MRKELLTLDVPNKNGRIYPKPVMEKAIVAALPLIDKKRFFIIRPSSLEPPSIDIGLEDVVGIVTNMEIVDDKVMVDVELLNTPTALPFKSILDSVNVSICGIGSLNKNNDGYFVVGEDYKVTYGVFT